MTVAEAIRQAARDNGWERRPNTGIFTKGELELVVSYVFGGGRIYSSTLKRNGDIVSYPTNKASVLKILKGEA